MRIIGIDPGYDIVGYGVIEKSGNEIKYVTHGAIKTNKNDSFKMRLLRIYEEFSQILSKYNPDIAAIEQIYFVQSKTTAMKVAQARGVILLALAKKDIEVEECGPQEVKMTVVGYGRARKSQVQKMIQILLNLPEIPKPDDAADALAIAWCSLSKRGVNMHGAGNQKL